MTEKINYKCKKCGLEWSISDKIYNKCPECESEDIIQEKVENELLNNQGQPRTRAGMRGRGTGAPRVCKCFQCGYESPKTPGLPCRQNKCPECGASLCGSD